MSDRKYTMLHLCDIYEAERVAMRKAVEATRQQKIVDLACIELTIFLSGIRALMDEIEAMVNEKEKESGCGE